MARKGMAAFHERQAFLSSIGMAAQAPPLIRDGLLLMLADSVLTNVLTDLMALYVVEEKESA